MVEFENCTKEGAGDGRMSVDYRVPVCRMPIGYRVPGLLRVEINGEMRGSTARLETSGLKSISDEGTVWRPQGQTVVIIKVEGGRENNGSWREKSSIARGP
jgi:hypothetical protein